MCAKKSAFLAVLLFAGLARPAPADDIPSKTKPENLKLDGYGDPLPPGAYARFGTVRLRHVAKAVAFFDDGTLVSVGSSIRFWDAKTGKLIREHRNYQMAGTTTAALSGDGKRAVTRNGEDVYRVWDVAAGRLIREFRSAGNLEIDHYSIPEISVSADGSRFVAREAYSKPNAGMGLRATVYSLDGKSQQIQIKTSIERGERDGCCVISPDGRQVAALTEIPNSNDRSQMLTFWDAENGKQLRTDKPDIGQLPGLWFTPDGKALVVTDYKSTVLRTLEGKELWRVGGEFADYRIVAMCARCVVLTARKTVQNADATFEIQILDVASGKVIGRWPMPEESRPEAAAVSPNGNRLVYTMEARLYVANSSDGKELVAAPGHGGTLFATSMSSDGRFLASSDWTGRDVLVWDVASGKIARRFEAPSEGAGIVAISPNGKFLACCAAATDGRVNVWDMSDGRIVAKLENPKHQSMGLVFLADSGRLAVVDTVDTHLSDVTVYQMPSGTMVHQFQMFGQAFLEGLFCTTDNRLLAVYKSYETNRNAPNGGSQMLGLDVWDVLARRIVRHLENATEGWANCALSPDGRTVAARAENGTIRFWELASGRPRLTIKEPAKADDRGAFERRYGFAFGQGFAFSPDGLAFAASNYDRPGIDLLDLPTGKRYGSLRGHELAVVTLQFTPVGRRLVTGSEDSTLLGWDLTRPESRSQPLVSNLTEADLVTHWDRLRNVKADEAYRSKWALVSDPSKTVEFLRTHLPSWVPIPAERIKAWIMDLDSDQLSIREGAQRQLQTRFDQAEDLLRTALAGNISAEARNRINRVIDSSFAAIPNLDQLRDLRAVEVLEQIGTPEARDLLHHLANGPVSTRASRDAAESLKRLEARPR